ncbi:Aspartic-type endopeptidase ctsD [Tolypocladium ophioglossoides CBS 100239]|uniref:Aspartic-type endopeptidase ctsD n=1 Tax=Tolypocladium ophioglossoides (strain CBS 100239) TaxID=1163406 RepID=A0A0L0NFC2_TOLOC|nr:Aspartic-type endopeptidase ctsD [Tolypocladium ophioglossoides CBS 100239]
MRLAVPLVQLALWASLASAFYPFTPDWLKEKEEIRVLGEDRRNVDGRDASGISFEIEKAGHASTPRIPRSTSASPSERAARDAARLSTKYEDRRPAKIAPDGALAKRANQYQITEAVDSGKAMTTGIDQDGTDYSYFVKVQFGSKGKPMYMLVDTGAGSSWVMSSSCTEKACLVHNTFGPSDSNTFEANSKTFSISYGSGTVGGELAADTITVAGVSFKYQFGLASQTSEDFAHFAFDGILGLSMSQGANDNFLKTMAEAHKLDKNVFCIALSRASDGANTGEIKFGSTNPDKYTGDITYTPVSAKDGDWAIPIDEIAYDGKKAQVGGVKSYIDTGTTFIFGPEDMVKKVHSVIPGSESSDGMTYTVPCDSTKPLTLTFSGVDFKISPQDWISPKDASGKCSSNIYGHEVVRGSWLLGDTFLKNVYTIFDKDQNRIGFANLAGSHSEQSSSSAATTTNAPTQMSGNFASGSATAFSTGITSRPDGYPQPIKPTQGLGGHETQSTAGTAAGGADKPTETSKSGAAGGSSQQNAKLAAVSFIAALLALVA